VAGYRRLHPWTVVHVFDSPAPTPRWVQEAPARHLAAQQEEPPLIEAKVASQYARLMELLSPHAF
jgi:hypothetical protein